MKPILQYLLVSVVIAVGVMLTTYLMQKDIASDREVYIYEVQVKELSDDPGWYYEIYKGNRLIIKQEHIPGVAGIQHFSSEEDAQKVAALVVNKLERMIIPSITKIDLENCNVDFKN
ncbi:DUF4907 domain-containing protein [Aquimarina sp. 2201CG5-10]|uniref:DUF4907 domain-containing protein n=1 Tax=Aquimarina callyspongiae TaxID=3098150 RepID=UPI002AB335A7|nr:DUF4907 domain-containing protein [Aquimarina sp. 2201CG5-10]MDY8136142.1 DUF4907 domain-containing protein [Aquimarina sp. 2201CG5-10]